MPAECGRPAMQCARLIGRDVVEDFDGGLMTRDSCAVLLGALERTRTGNGASSYCGGRRSGR